MEFERHGGSTEIVVTHELFPTVKARGDHERGWSGCLDRLAETLAA